MLTEDDDIIRAQDIPERMQLATSSMSSNASISLHSPLRQDDINGAAMWITQRISPRKTREFFSPQGAHQQLKAALVMAVTFVVTHIFIEEYEVPFLWTHRRDNLSYFDPNDGRNRFELLSQAELWRVYSLGKRYRSLVERRRSLETAYDRLQVEDKYYEEEIQSQIDSVEMIADVSEWLSMKYKDKKNEDNTFHFHDDEEVEATKKRKMPSRVSAYEMTKKSIVSRLAQVSLVLLFLAGHSSSNRVSAFNLTKLCSIIWPVHTSTTLMIRSSTPQHLLNSLLILIRRRPCQLKSSCDVLE